MVTGPGAGHAWTNVLDDAGPLMAANARKTGLHVAGPEVLVGVAEAGRDVADQHLSLARRVEVQLRELPVALARASDHGGCRLHLSPPGTTFSGRTR
jgi:hypothetical protein